MAGGLAGDGTADEVPLPSPLLSPPPVNTPAEAERGSSRGRQLFALCGVLRDGEKPLAATTASAAVVAFGERPAPNTPGRSSQGRCSESERRRGAAADCGRCTGLPPPPKPPPPPPAAADCGRCGLRWRVGLPPRAPEDGDGGTPTTCSVAWRRLISEMTPRLESAPWPNDDGGSASVSLRRAQNLGAP